MSKTAQRYDENPIHKISFLSFNTIYAKIFHIANSAYLFEKDKKLYIFVTELEVSFLQKNNTKNYVWKQNKTLYTWHLV